MTILDTILTTKQQEVDTFRKETFPTRTIPLRTKLSDRLRSSDTLEVIAEIKRASPSKGVIHPSLDAVELAKRYEKSGAAAISVLTDTTYFKGSFDDLKAVAESVEVPVLCKEFIIDTVQIEKAYAHGASLILLIVAALEAQTLHKLFTFATDLGLEVLVEVHTPEELATALELGAELIGVNNRNLKTFEVSLETTQTIAELLPRDRGIYLISESGIVSAHDALQASSFGAHGLLVGESLVRSNSVEEALPKLKVRRHTDDAH
ncbi:indole-3-glycerol phosphate synthase TrpC [Chryseomicrobium palamuruense]|uniref:Indole-3-glycerol phosphate synthase n=1 Tax=Chryseomicrobium palamuruense TaxID=682973 RepID=A0ABV8UWR5_9BACL